MEILSIKNLNKAFGPNKALTDIDLDIPQGVIYGLLGPNGAGKTTLIRIINQIIEADSGDIYFENQILNPNHIGQIGYLPEERGLYKRMKVWDQLIYFARLKGLSASLANERVNFWLDKMDIKNWKDKRIDDLSKGMAQKVQFISTIIHEPKLLILDEPFSGFDPVNADLIKNEILELKQKGITLVLSTHRMESVELLCDHVAMINRSKKILDGKLSEIKQTFRPNEYEVIIRNEDRILPEEWEVKWEDQIATFNIKLRDKTENESLSYLMQFGEILGFSEKIPSMEELFIQQVNLNSDG
ncbi:MAG: ATP-binding cassette domain-containing protein [Mongoliibacter sp.]|uniref:ABC transporter ATP-binding protein n=1 Tax=Mongoliibacter sp. TaxID=2022438 RepID=UPI0012F31ABF|nr:ATP-binding cassette domain-containing protein [Mongoliibacter sp.]TVP49861.1 MAG: ATP-binding cassette domain-containing protein [Mongoliibacter sp.]